MAGEEEVEGVELDAKHLAATIKVSGGLLGVNASAKALGVPPSNFVRYRDRLTEIEVEGSAAVFSKVEVGALADELEQRRAKKAAKGASG